MRLRRPAGLEKAEKEKNAHTRVWRGGGPGGGAPRTPKKAAALPYGAHDKLNGKKRRKAKDHVHKSNNGAL